MTDNELLERLAAALAPNAVPADPPAASMQNLHRAIDLARSGGAATWGSHRGPRRLTIAVAAGVLAVVGVALVAATSLRRIDGEIAIEATTTVNSPALLEAQASSEALEDALKRRDVTDVVAEAEKVRALLSRLTPSDRAIIDPEAGVLLERADRFVEQHAPTTTTVTTISSTLPPSTAPALLVPAATSPVTSAAPAVTSASSPSTALAMTIPGPTVDPDDNSGSNSGPGGGGSGEDGSDVDSVDDPDDNSGPGGGSDSGSGGGNGS